MLSPFIASAHRNSTTLACTGVGRVCTYPVNGHDLDCVEKMQFTGTIEVNVLSEGLMNGHGWTDGTTEAYDYEGTWVRGHFVIRWNGHSFEPAPVPHLISRNPVVLVWNDFDYAEGGGDIIDAL